MLFCSNQKLDLAALVAMLSADAAVARPPVELFMDGSSNCGDTERGAADVVRWLGGRSDWTVIHMNWGLHDL